MANKKFKLGIILSASDKVTAPLNKVQQRLKGFGTTIQNQKNKWSLKSSALGIPALRKSFGGFASSLKPIGYAFGAISIAGVGAFAAIKSSADKLSNLGHLSHSVDMSAESIQKWRYAAQNSESSAEDMDAGLKKFTLSMGQARAGSGKLLTFLNKINPAFSKQLLNVKSNEEAFEMMIGAIAKVEDPQRRMALSVAAFGSTAGESLARMASSGTASIQALREEAERLGIATTKDTVAAEAFGDNLNKMVWALDAVKNTISVSLMPVITEFFKKITGWLSENQEKVKGFAKMLADNLPGAIQKTVGFLSSLVNHPITRFLVWISDKLGVVYIAFAAIGIYVAGTFISILASLATLLSALGVTFVGVWAAALGPIGIVIGAIALLGVASLAIYKYWDDICELFQKAWKWVSKIAGVGWDKITNILGFSKKEDASKDQSSSKIAGAQVLGVQSSQKIAGAESLGAQQMGQRYFDNNSSKKSETELRVSFDNAPKGTRVQTEKAVNSNLDLSMGYSMVTP